MQNIRKVLSYDHIVTSNGHVNTKPHMQKEQYNLNGTISLKTITQNLI